MELENFNPDGVASPEELDEWAGAFSDLRKYCAVKSAAMRSRLAGDITDALRLEASCDAIYRRLPEGIRW